MDYSAKINANIYNLLNKNFQEYIKDDKFLFNVGVENKEISLNSCNIEKICFALGPGRLLKDNKFLHTENNISGNAIDFAYIAPYENRSIYMGLIENKQLDKSLEYTIKKTVGQIYNQYLINLLGTTNNFFEHSKERPNNIAISIAIFDVEKYLQTPYNFNNYCNDGLSNAETRLKQYGFVILTTFINVFSIKKEADLQKEFDKFLNTTSKENLSYIIPEMKVFQGYIQKDAFDSILNTNVTISFEQLSNLPFFNMNTSSQISNTRDFSLKNATAEKFKQDIFKTLLVNFKNSQSKKNTITMSESYRSLGAKNREVSFYIPQTIVFLDEICSEKMNQKAYYITTNMSLIDGQHSSVHLIDIVQALKSNDINTLDNSYKIIINKIFNKESDFLYEEFTNFVKNHHINISFKGFSKEDVAQKAAANQNNIKKQTAFEKLLNNNRTKLLKIINFYNRLEFDYKMKVNKSTWSNELLINKNTKVLSAEYLVNIWAFWNENFFNEYNKKDLNKIIGKQSSLTTPNANNFSKAIDWYINKDIVINEINKKLIDVLACIEKIVEYDDTDENDDSCEALTKKYKEQIKKTLDFYDKNREQFRGRNLHKNLDKLITYLDDDDDFGKLSNHINTILIELDNVQEVLEHRVTNGMQIIQKVTEYYENNTNDFKFLDERKTEAFFYILNIINLHLVLALKNKGQLHNIEQINDELINQVIEDVKERLIKADKYVNASNKTLSALNFGNNQHSMDNDFDTILFK